MNYLPALVTELPEAPRIMYARSDLDQIGAQAQQQIEVHRYATGAAAEVLRAAATMEVPNREAVGDLYTKYLTPPEFSADEQIRIARQHGRQMVTTRDEPPRITSRSMGRRLHPDVGPTDAANKALAEGFKSITAAQKAGDETLAQGLYAKTVASTVANMEGPNATALEKDRYQAWMALQAGKGRFGTKEDVDAWKESELALAPYRSRAQLLGTTSGLFELSLGADEQGLVVADDCFVPISRGLEITQRVIKRVMGDEITAGDLSRVNLSSFDNQLTVLLGQLAELLRSQIVRGASWSYSFRSMASRFGEALGAAAEELEGNQVPLYLERLLGSSALGGLPKKDHINLRW